MLEAMRQLALDWLQEQLGETGDPEAWFREVRRMDPERLLPYLVEPPSEAEYYTLSADPCWPDTAVLSKAELKGPDDSSFPFVQSTGNNQGAVGPVIKVGQTSPASGTQRITLRNFRAKAEAGGVWSCYFAEAVRVFEMPSLRIEGVADGVPAAAEESNALGSAVGTLQHKKGIRAVIALRNDEGMLPGMVKAYRRYLVEELPGYKYETKEAPHQDGKRCALCDGFPTTVYPNALRGAGFNFGNVDRHGAFPGLVQSAAWKGFPLCLPCADLLYTYRYHVTPEFLISLAGDDALVVPYTWGDASLRSQLIEGVRDHVRYAPEEGATNTEEMLLQDLGASAAVTTLTFLWADFSGRVEDVAEVLTDVLPSRVQEVERLNVAMSGMDSPVFPARGPDFGFRYDLRLSALGALLRSGGGRKTSEARLLKHRETLAIKRHVASAIYHDAQVDWPRLREVLIAVARLHLAQALRPRSSPPGKTKGGYPPPQERAPWLCEDYYYRKDDETDKARPSLAAWTRHLAKFLFYLRKAEVMPASGSTYPVRMAALEPYFTDSAIDSPERAFAFTLGVLFGKMMQIQAMREVSVRGNALTWLKRLTLTGEDLKRLHNQVRAKMLDYQADEPLPEVLELEAQLADFGLSCRDLRGLDQVDACFYLLLGQALATKIIPAV